jgi:hypothetical protein
VPHSLVCDAPGTHHSVVTFGQLLERAARPALVRRALSRQLKRCSFGQCEANTDSVSKSGTVTQSSSTEPAGSAVSSSMCGGGPSRVNERVYLAFVCDPDATQAQKVSQKPGRLWYVCYQCLADSI